MATTRKTMPAVFVGHGNPMNIVRQNRWTDGWTALGASLPRPRAILAISAHWYVPATMVTAMPRPRTIHDFGGFPRELYEITYPAPGDPGLAKKVRDALDSITVGLDIGWGLDHGTWSVLSHIYPAADVPVLQLSINRTESPSFHYEIGRLLAPLRDEGVLLLGSGNLVHNIGAYDWDNPDAKVHGWSSRFEAKVRDLLQAGKERHLLDYGRWGLDAELSVPTPDHYLPLLYVLGARQEGDDLDFPIEGFDGGSMSMLAVRFG